MKIATLVGLAAILESGASVGLQEIEASWTNCFATEKYRATEECRDYVWGFKVDEI